MRFFRYLKNRSGAGLIQVLVASLIASALGLAIAQMISNTRVAQKRVGVMWTVKEQQERIRNLILDQSAFNHTINDATYNNNALFTALRNGTAVTEGVTYKVALFDATGSTTTALNLLGPTDNAGPYNGFTEKGTFCSTFYPTIGQGRDDCPISYRLLISANCPLTGETSCIDPQLAVVARLLYNPSQGSQLDKFRNVVAQSTDATTAQSSDVTSTGTGLKFDVAVARTASSIARSFRISSFTPAGSNSLGLLCGALVPTGGGAGACDIAAPGLTVVHPMTLSLIAGLEEEFDPQNLVSIGVAGTGSFSFRELGTYTCSASAVGFSTGFYSIAIRNGTAATNVGVGSGFASTNAEVQVRADTSFSVTSTSDLYYITQHCASQGIEPFCSSGFARNPYANRTRIVSLTCSKLDSAF